MERKVVKIDEELCDGCGLCVPSCAEGAIQIIDGKAKLIDDSFCDGLGACLGECPQGAIEVEEREAVEFDEEAVKVHMAQQAREESAKVVEPGQEKKEAPAFVCPSARLLNLGESKQNADTASHETGPSKLSHWPVKLRLVPPQAPFLKDADLMLIADCVPFAYPDTHQKFLAGRKVVIGCPKFDDQAGDTEKLTNIIREGQIKSLTVVHMEVPCCFGYLQTCKEAVKTAGKNIPFNQVIIGVHGELKQELEVT